MECDRFFLSFLAIFCTFTLLTTWKIKILKKWEKRLQLSSFYTCLPKIRIIWCMLPEIWSVTDRFFIIFSHFLHLPPPKFLKSEKNSWRYYLFLHMYHKWRLYDVWFQKYKVQWTECFVILGHFSPFYPTTTHKIKIFKKSLEIFDACVTKIRIILCMVPNIWSVINRFFCHFGPLFAFLNSQQPRKSKFRKHEKDT